MLNPEQLQTFVAVADTGSFSAAATRLGFTQPAVTRQIKALEAALGEVRLFRRVGKAVRLTHAGEELLLHAREVVDVLARAEQHMHGLRGQITGRVALGCAPDGSEHLVAGLVGAFHRKQPGVQFAVDIVPPGELLNWLDRAQVQAVMLDAQPRRQAYDVLPLRREPIVAVCANDHPLRAKAAVSVADVAGEHLIMPPPSTALRRQLNDLINRHSMDRALQIVLETGSAATALHGASVGLGVAFVPEHAAACAPGVAVLPVTNFAPEQTWYLVRGRGDAAHRAMDAVWNFVAASLETQSTETVEPVAEE